MVEAIRDFFVGFWEWGHCRYYLAGIGVVYLILAIPFRQPGKAAGVLLLGLYVTLTAYFLSIYQKLGFTQEASFAVVIVCGLALCGLFYYFYFIREE